MFDMQHLQQILVDKWDYKERQTRSVVSKLLNMAPAILAAFEGWLETDFMPDAPAFSGLTPKSLHETYPLKPPAAFLLLDWIRREPERALQALQERYGEEALQRAQKAIGQEPPHHPASS